MSARCTGKLTTIPGAGQRGFSQECPKIRVKTRLVRRRFHLVEKHRVSATWISEDPQDKPAQKRHNRWVLMSPLSNTYRGRMLGYKSVVLRGYGMIPTYLDRYTYVGGPYPAYVTKQELLAAWRSSPKRVKYVHESIVIRELLNGLTNFRCCFANTANST